MGFTKSEVDPNLYYILVGSDMLILILYVDDLFLKISKNLIEGCNENMETKFEMKDIEMLY
jgi:hypothetical protein